MGRTNYLRGGRGGQFWSGEDVLPRGGHLCTMSVLKNNSLQISGLLEISLTINKSFSHFKCFLLETKWFLFFHKLLRSALKVCVGGGGWETPIIIITQLSCIRVELESALLTPPKNKQE